MSPYLVATVLVAVTALPSSAAGPCVATADRPQAVDAVVIGSGTFACAIPRTGMTVTVCVESWRAPAVGWQVEACASRTAAGSASSVSQTVGACVLGGPALVRTTATGHNDAGEAASAQSLPAWAPGFGSCGP